MPSLYQRARNAATRKYRNVAASVGYTLTDKKVQDAIIKEYDEYSRIDLLNPYDDRFNDINQNNTNDLITEINNFIEKLNNKFINTTKIKKLDILFNDIGSLSTINDYTRIIYTDNEKNIIFNTVYIPQLHLNPPPNQYSVISDLYRLFIPELDNYIDGYNTIILGYIKQIFLIKNIDDLKREKDAAIKTKDDEIKEKDAILKTKDEEIAALKTQQINYNGNKQQLEELTAQRDRLIQEKEEEIAKLKNENEKLLNKVPNVVQNNLPDANIGPIIAATTAAIVSSTANNPIANNPINVNQDMIKLIYFLAHNRALQLLQKPDQVPKKLNLNKLEQTIKDIQTTHSKTEQILRTQNDKLIVELNKLRKQIAETPLAATPLDRTAPASTSTSPASTVETKQKSGSQLNSITANLSDIMPLVDAYNKGGDSHDELNKQLEKYKEKFKGNPKIVSIINELLKK